MKLIDLRKTERRHLSFAKKGQYLVFFHNLSGKLVFELNTSGIELYIYGLYTGSDKERYNIETIQHHTSPGSTSDLLIKGVFDGSSKFIYQGLIRLDKGAQQSHAYQKNQNLIISPDVFVDSRPFLEILANDVFCTHGSTTGRINQEQILYLQSRGLTKKDAQNAIISGFTNEVVLKVKEKVSDFEF
jgi:Fe-S cluster assembly protein SufD